MFTPVQRNLLTVLRLFDEAPELADLQKAMTVSVTEVGMKRTLTVLQRGGLVKEFLGFYELTEEGKNCMRSQGAEHAASKKLKKSE